MPCAGDAGEEFQGEDHRAAGGQCGRALGRTQRIAQSDDDLAPTVAGQIGRQALAGGPGGADLEEDIGGEGLVPAFDQLGALVGVELVGEARRLAGPALDQDREARFDQRRDARRDQGDAFLTGERLFSNCYDHK